LEEIVKNSSPDEINLYTDTLTNSDYDAPLSVLEMGAKVIAKVVKTLPTGPGVYRMISAADQVLYVGKAKSLKKRVPAYTKTGALPNRLQRMVAETVRMEIVTTHTETEALLLESNLIKKLQPRYNILLKDDKSFPYILLTGDHDFPRVVKHRGSKNIKGDYYGPFASVMAVDEAVLTLQRVFQIRNCNDTYFANRARPCLQYDIKRCTGPCVDKISKHEYAESVKQAKNFLLGKSDQVQTYLSERMVKASEAMEYEKAASYRDRLRLLTHIQSRQRINISGLENADVIGLAQLGGQACVQIFFFRHGRNYGTESFFLTHLNNEPEEEIMAAFVNQFYRDRPPAPLVLLSHEPADFPLIKAALAEHHQEDSNGDKKKPEKTDWQLPLSFKRKDMKTEVVKHAVANAKGNIERKQTEAASMHKILKEMQVVFGLSKMPERIEVYDNSHIQGSNPYGIMVVANTEGFDKKSYRKFAIKQVEDTRDDYAMMREVIGRRLSRYGQDDWNAPDIMLIDGGAGQLSAVFDAMAEVDPNFCHQIPVVAIAKGPERNAGRERFFMRDKVHSGNELREATTNQPSHILSDSLANNLPNNLGGNFGNDDGHMEFSLPQNSPLLYFLQRLRDEAHRFAIGTHRSKRSKALGKSKLDEVPGIGPSRKKLLLHHFGSAQGVARAALADLEAVKGVSRAVALKIYQHFHS